MTMTYTKAFVLIGVCVACWGVFHAVGAYFGGMGPQHLRHDVRRTLMVIGSVVAFLAFWATMLAARKRRLARESDAKPPT
jgi:membrane protein DedA with SNARE-associated domain